MSYQSIKKIFDVALAVVLLFVLLPLSCLIILLYLLSGSVHFLFRQERSGLCGKPFTLYKFRTLSSDVQLRLKERQFPLGKILRSTSLDEMPQLVNVIKGEMSFVGPRPLPVAYYNLMTASERKRYEVMPGITGWAQINGRNQITWHDKFALDLYYCKNMSFKLDMLILLRTFLLLWSFKKDRSLDEKPFTGHDKLKLR